MAHLPPFNDQPLMRSDSWRTIAPGSAEATPSLEGPIETPEQRNEAEEAEFFAYFKQKNKEDDIERRKQKIREQRPRDYPWLYLDQDDESALMAVLYDVCPNEFPDELPEEPSDLYEAYRKFRCIRDSTWCDDVLPLHDDLRKSREAFLLERGLVGV